MPLYTITTQAGVLDSPAKADLADKLTAFHGEYAGVPKNWVHVVFHEYPIGSGFTAGKPASTAALTLFGPGAPRTISGKCSNACGRWCKRQPARPMRRSSRRVR